MRFRDERGQSLVEIAFVLPVLLLILLGIFDFGRAIYAYNAVSNSAREAARLAIVNQSSAAVIAEGKRAAIGLDPSRVNVTFPAPSCSLIGCEVAVTVDHEWRAITPLLQDLIGPIRLEATTEMPLERVYSSP
jgi:Flp pilus assembly protein TadG